MNKKQFLRELTYAIEKLPKAEVNRVVNYYSETIEDRMEEGMTEEESVRSLESISSIVEKTIAENHYSEYPYEVQTKKKRGALTTTLLILGSPIWAVLFLAAAIVALALYISLWAVIISLYAVVLSFGIAAIAGILGFLVIVPGNLAAGIMLMGMAIMCAGLAVLSFFGTAAASKYLLNLAARCLQWTKKTWSRRKV